MGARAKGSSGHDATGGRCAKRTVPIRHPIPGQDTVIGIWVLGAAGEGQGCLGRQQRCAGIRNLGRGWDTGGDGAVKPPDGAIGLSGDHALAHGDQCAHRATDDGVGKPARRRRQEVDAAVGAGPEQAIGVGGQGIDRRRRGGQQRVSRQPVGDPIGLPLIGDQIIAADSSLRPLRGNVRPRAKPDMLRIGRSGIDIVGCQALASPVLLPTALGIAGSALAIDTATPGASPQCAVAGKGQGRDWLLDAAHTLPLIGVES